MNNIKNKLVILGGIIVGILALASNYTYADANKAEDMDSEQYALVETLVNEMAESDDLELISKSIYKVYNLENQLIYESRNKDDQRLKGLLKKSDLLTTVDQAHYYKLSH